MQACTGLPGNSPAHPAPLTGSLSLCVCCYTKQLHAINSPTCWHYAFAGHFFLQEVV
ncbi:hypothetical protein FLA_3137 [Filimonas lacunae]|nr:hypothetical protein FLA_3137 [Filimonas lacunae]